MNEARALAEASTPRPRLRVVGIDLNAEYLEMAVRRCAQQGLMPAEGVS